MMKSNVIVCFLSATVLSAFAQVKVNPTGVNVNTNGATTVFLSFGNLANQVPVEAFWCGELTNAAPDVGQKCDPGKAAFYA